MNMDTTLATKFHSFWSLRGSFERPYACNINFEMVVQLRDLLKSYQNVSLSEMQLVIHQWFRLHPGADAMFTISWLKHTLLFSLPMPDDAIDKIKVINRFLVNLHKLQKTKYKHLETLISDLYTGCPELFLTPDPTNSYGTWLTLPYLSLNDTKLITQQIRQLGLDQFLKAVKSVIPEGFQIPTFEELKPVEPMLYGIDENNQILMITFSVSRINRDCVVRFRHFLDANVKTIMYGDFEEITQEKVDDFIKDLSQDGLLTQLTQIFSGHPKISADELKKIINTWFSENYVTHGTFMILWFTTTVNTGVESTPKESQQEKIDAFIDYLDIPNGVDPKKLENALGHMYFNFPELFLSEDDTNPHEQLGLLRELSIRDMKNIISYILKEGREQFIDLVRELTCSKSQQLPTLSSAPISSEESDSSSGVMEDEVPSTPNPISSKKWKLKKKHYKK